MRSTFCAKLLMRLLTYKLTNSSFPGKHRQSALVNTTYNSAHSQTPYNVSLYITVQCILRYPSIHHKPCSYSGITASGASSPNNSRKFSRSNSETSISCSIFDAKKAATLPVPFRVPSSRLTYYTPRWILHPATSDTLARSRRSGWVIGICCPCGPRAAGP